MKILYVGHTYTVRANHAKIAALARAMPNAEITLLTPHAWKGPLYENRTDLFEKQSLDALPPGFSFQRTWESTPILSASNSMDSRARGNGNSFREGAEPASPVGIVDHRILRAYFIGKEGAYFFGPSIISLLAGLKPDIVHVEQGAYAVVYAQILFLLRLFSPRSKAAFFTWWNLPYTPRGVKKLTERFNLSHSAAAVAGNEAAKAILQQHGFHQPIYVLPQLGMELPTVVERPLRSTDAFVIGYAGRITKEKGVLDLVDAVSKMQTKSNVSLYFVGAGDALEVVRRRAALNNIPLTHQPPVMNDALPAHLLKMDVLVLPSLSTPEWVEQFGHILLEAMAYGIPVIGSSSGEIPNVIGEAGLIFTEGDSLALARHLDQLLCEPQTCKTLAQTGRRRVDEHFTQDIIARKQAAIYDWMLREGRSIGGGKART